MNIENSHYLLYLNSSRPIVGMQQKLPERINDVKNNSSHTNVYRKDPECHQENLNDNVVHWHVSTFKKEWGKLGQFCNSV